MAEKGPPTDIVLGLMQEGKTKDQIIEELKNKGHGIQQINEAFNQANIKKGVEGAMPPSGPAQGGKMAEEEFKPSEEMQVSEIEKEEIPVPAPTPAAAEGAPQTAAEPYGTMPTPQEMAAAYQQQPAAMPQAGVSYEDVQSLVEEVIDEKWRELMATVGDITTWKAQMSDENEAIKQEILRVQTRFDNLQAAVLGKVDEYTKSITDISTEMRALEKVFEKIVEPLATNIKELSKLTEELRGHKKK